MARLYSYDEIKNALSCEEYLRTQGITLNNDGRCAATWRGGTNPNSVHVTDKVWHDFSLKKGGSVIDLAAMIEFNGDFVRAVQDLGDRLKLTPSIVTKKVIKSRSQQLIADGYKETATYEYCDENSVPIYSVVRFEKDGEKKQFVHRTPKHEGLDADTPKLLYNLPALIKSPEVFIVEGEKDVETLRSYGLVGCTNSGGASNWEQRFNKYFDGKDVIIIADNDDAGQKHGNNLYALLKGIAKSIKMLTVSSLPHGDITDWFTKEGGSIQKLRELIAGEVNEKKSESPEIVAAKMANEKPFTNFSESETIVGGRVRVEEVPYLIDDILEDIKTRFLGFPRVLGDVMFDWTMKTGKVQYILNKNDLFAWIQRISHNKVVWSNGREMVSKEELFCALHQSAIKYSGLSNSPHFPSRKDVFYVHEALPPPDHTHSSFWKLISYFCPANETYRKLIAAMFIAPIYYEESAERPMWIVDTDDAQSSGKTTLVKLIASLYGDTPFIVDIKDIDNNFSQVMRRMISSSGRTKRIALMDNITRSLRSQNLSTLITLEAITGLAPYGRMEESRPNDITYVVTVNGAQVDTDIATRSYTVRLVAPKNLSANWEHEVRSFIELNRLQIFSDIIHMIQTNPLKVSRQRSRFGRFDSIILAAVCSSVEEFNAVDETLKGESSRANEDYDRAQEFHELFIQRIAESKEVSTEYPIYVRASDIDTFLSHTDGVLQNFKSAQIRAFIKQGLLPQFNKDIDRFPSNSSYDYPRLRGFMFGPYNPHGHNKVQMVMRNAGNYFKVDKILEIKARK